MNFNLSPEILRVLKYAAAAVLVVLVLPTCILGVATCIDGMTETTLMMRDVSVTEAECVYDPISSWSLKTPTCNIHVVDVEKGFELYARIRDDNKWATVMVNGVVTQVPVCNGWSKDPACVGRPPAVLVERGRVDHMEEVGCTTLEPYFSVFEYGNQIILWVKDKIVLTQPLPEQFTPIHAGPHAAHEGF